MPPLKLPGVHVVRKRLSDGTRAVYHYAWRGGPRLPDPADTQAYLLAYADAVRAKSAPIPRTPRTLSDLVSAYRASQQYAKLAPATRKHYERRLDAIEEAFGTLPVDALAARGMRREIKAWHEGHHATRDADTRLQVLSALLSWAVEAELAPTNPASGIARRHERIDHSDVVWTPDELAKLFAAADAAPRRAFVVAAYTGLRLGDVIGLRWSEVDLAERVIERPTNKSRGRTRAYIPILEPVRDVLADLDQTTPAVLVNTWGNPWTVSGIQTAFHRAKDAAGVDKRFHDLRGTAATMFARAGLSAPEIARCMGWGERRVEEIITRYVSRREVAAEIARRLGDQFTDS